MKKSIVLMLVVTSSAMMILGGCKNVNVNISFDGDKEGNETLSDVESAGEDENASDDFVGMANPMVEVLGDDEFRDKLGIDIDSSYFGSDISRFIISDSIAQVSFNIEDTEGEDVGCTFRATKDATLYESPVEGFAGVYDENLGEIITVDIPVRQSTIAVNKVHADTEDVDIAYFAFNDTYFSLVTGGGISQMEIGELYDSMLLAAGAEQVSKTIKPLELEIDVESGVTVNVSINKLYEQDDKLMGDFELYTMELYDAVDIAEMKAGDTIIIYDEEMEVTSVERGDDVKLPATDGTDEEELCGVYLINGGDDMGGFELISNGGGTFRMFGYNDYASYSDRGKYSLPISKDVVLSDHLHDYDDVEPHEEGYTASGVKDVQKYLEAEGLDGFGCYNTSIVVENGEITEINRIFVP